MYRYYFTGLILLASGCQLNPKFDSGWGSYGRKTCVFLGKKMECDTLSTMFMVPGAITVILLPAVLIYLLNKNHPTDNKDTTLYRFLVHPFTTVLALIGLFCAALSVAYDGPIDFADSPWSKVGILAIFAAMVSLVVNSREE